MSLRLVSLVALDQDETSQAQGSVARLVEAELEESRARTALMMAEMQLAEDRGSLARAQASQEEALEDVVKAWSKLQVECIEALRADPDYKKLFITEQLAEMKRNIARNEDQAKKAEHKNEGQRYQGKRPGNQGRPGPGAGGTERGGHVNQQSTRAGGDSSGFRNPVKNAGTLLQQDAVERAAPVVPSP